MEQQDTPPPEAAASRSERPSPPAHPDKIHMDAEEAKEAAQEGQAADVGGSAGADVPRGG